MGPTQQAACRLRPCRWGPHSGEGADTRGRCLGNGSAQEGHTARPLYFPGLGKAMSNWEGLERHSPCSCLPRPPSSVLQGACRTPRERGSCSLPVHSFSVRGSIPQNKQTHLLLCVSRELKNKIACRKDDLHHKMFFSVMSNYRVFFFFFYWWSQ